jgi:hypothetical protein
MKRKTGTAFSVEGDLECSFDVVQHDVEQGRSRVRAAAASPTTTNNPLPSRLQYTHMQQLVSGNDHATSEASLEVRRRRRSKRDDGH